MPSISHSLDYMQYSVDWPSGISTIPDDRLLRRSILSSAIPHMKGKFNSGLTAAPEMRGLGGYTIGESFGIADVFANPDRLTQRIGVRMTGDNIAYWRGLGNDDMQLVRFVRDIGAKVSRMDIAFDLRDYGIKPSRIYSDWKAGKFQTTARTAQPVTRGVMEKNGQISEAETVYFGSRQSAIMLRIYDKGMESGEGGDWIRFEIELKDERAQAALNDCAIYGIDNTARGILDAFIIKANYRFYRDIMDGKTKPMEPIGRKLTDRQAWIMNVIIPLLREEVAGEWESDTCYGLTETIESIVSQQWRELADRLNEQYRNT